jgi:dTDP-4-amino-4,6-dideoxygalactose transaminase
MIPFNKPFLTGNEIKYIEEAVKSGKISGNGVFTKRCQTFLEQHYGFKKVLLTTSCTDALEMCAILAEIEPGDEVIVPSYTFVSTALAFVRQGAKIVFADSRNDNPGIDEEAIESLITSRTKAIIPVHYAGIACDMDKITAIAAKYKLLIIEDAAQAIDSFYLNKPLGSFGDLAAFSFHETKNINAGEGGMLVINNDSYIKRAEIIWEKGTNRAEFFRGEVNKYGWMDIGSSFLPSEITSAFLWAQLEKLDEIQSKRKLIWEYYKENLKSWALENEVELPVVPDYATQNGHLFYIVFKNIEDRTMVISRLKENDIFSVTHYISLHSSKFYSGKHDGRNLKEADRYTDTLLRLPLYYNLTEGELKRIVETITGIKLLRN